MLSPSVSRSALLEWLQLIVGERHLRSSKRHHAAVAALIRQTFLEAGFEVREQPVPGPFGTGSNIIARRQGSHRPHHEWLLGAHYDTVRGTPGADDNGVAVAGLLETARILADRSTRDTIELVAWDLEEHQLLPIDITRGSKVMARQARAAGRLIRGVLVLEMIGCRLTAPGTQRLPAGFGLLFPKVRRWLRGRGNRGDFLAAVGDSQATELLRAVQKAADQLALPVASMVVRGAARLVPDFYRSDHAPFWSRSYPAVLLTDTADFRNRNYHRAGDTINTLDLDFACQVMNTAVAALLDLADGAGSRC